MAERWEISDDKKVYTFHLRNGARWSDGRPLTAHDFVYSWRRVLDPRTGSKYASQLFVLANGEAFHKGRAPAEAVGVRAMDDHTLRVDLQDPIPFFIPLITHLYTMWPVPRWVVERFDGTSRPERWTLPENIVTNGPYRFVEWQFRHRMIFEKSPHYWDAANVRMKRVVSYEVESYATTLNLYKAGEIDYIGENTSLPSELMSLLRTKRDYVHAPYLSVYFYWINTKQKPLDDPRVRRALNMAIDKQALCDYVKRGGEIPATTITPPGLAGYEPPDGDPYDPKRARALLGEAGFPDGRGFPGFTLVYNTSEGHKLIAETIQQMWKRELGIDVAIENQEWQVYVKRLETMEFQMARMGWVGDYADPYTFLEIFSPDSGNNHSNWKDPAFKSLLDAGNAQLDPRARYARFRDAERAMLDVLPIIPLYVYTRSYLVKPYVKGIWPNLMDKHPWRAMWIE